MGTVTELLEVFPQDITVLDLSSIIYANYLEYRLESF